MKTSDYSWNVLWFCYPYLLQSLNALSGCNWLLIHDMSEVLIENCIKTIFIIPLCISGKNMQYTVSYQ